MNSLNLGSLSEEINSHSSGECSIYISLKTVLNSFNNRRRKNSTKNNEKRKKSFLFIKSHVSHTIFTV